MKLDFGSLVDALAQKFIKSGHTSLAPVQVRGSCLYTWPGEMSADLTASRALAGSEYVDLSVQVAWRNEHWSGVSQLAGSCPNLTDSISSGHLV